MSGSARTKTDGPPNIVTLDSLRELAGETKLVEIDGVAGAFRLRRISIKEFIELQEEAKGDDGEPDEWEATVGLLMAGVVEPELDPETCAMLPLFVTKQLAEEIGQYGGVDQSFGGDSPTE